MTDMVTFLPISDIFPVLSSSYLWTLDLESLYSIGNTIAYYKNSCSPALASILANTPIEGPVLDEIGRNMGSYQNFTGHPCEAPVNNNSITQFSEVMERNKMTLGRVIVGIRTGRSI